MQENYIENCMLKAPGLAIKTGGSAIAMITNACALKYRGKLSTSIDASTDMPGLETAKNANGVVVGNLETAHSRIYTFLAVIGEPTGAAVAPVTFTVVASDDLDSPTTVPVMTDKINMGNGEVVVGHLLVMNLTGSDFIPGTTALDASGIYSAYIDQFGFVGR